MKRSPEVNIFPSNGTQDECRVLASPWDSKTCGRKEMKPKALSPLCDTKTYAKDEKEPNELPSPYDAAISGKKATEPDKFPPPFDSKTCGKEERDPKALPSSCGSKNSGKKAVHSNLNSEAPFISPQQPVLRPASHHQQEALCVTRPRYRQGRRLTAVKVYTVADESVYLLICGVPSISLTRELKNLCLKRGKLLELKALSDYPKEAFTDVFLVKYECLKQARLAKKFLDGRNFFGGLLHVCYAPELETVEETRKKLHERRVTVSRALDEMNSQGSILAQYHPQDKLSASVKRVSRRLRCSDDVLKPSSEATSNPENLHLEEETTILMACAIDRNLENREHSVEFNSVQPSESSCCRLDDSETDLSRAGSNSISFSNKRFKSDQFSCYSGGGNRVANVICPPERSSTEFIENHVRNPSIYNEEKACENLSGPDIGHVYASMDSDYEPGIGRISGERYSCSSSVSNKNRKVDSNGSNITTSRKSWAQISNEIKKKKRMAQPRSNRLETKELSSGDKICDLSKISTNYQNFSAKENSAINSQIFSDSDPHQAKQTRVSMNFNLDRTQGKNILPRRDEIRKTGRYCSNNSVNASKTQFLDAIRAAAAVSFGAVPDSAVRKVSKRSTPRMSQKNDVRLLNL